MPRILLALLLALLLASSSLPAQTPPLFEDWTERAGLQAQDAPYGVWFADLDNDRFPDAIVNGGKIFLNEKGSKFVRVKDDRAFAPDEKAEPAVPPHGLVVGDANGDGNLDLFVTFNIDPEGEGFKDHGRRNELWLGDGKGGFALKKDTGISTEPATTCTGMFFDYDGDDKVDLYVGNWWKHPWKSPEVLVSPLYRGRGDGTFEDVTKAAGIEGDAEPEKRTSRRPIFCATHTDWNNDGRQDLLIGTYAGRWNVLWRNNGDGTFTDVGQETGFDCDARGRWFAYGGADNPYCNVFLFSCPSADFDCDGDMDCFQATIRHWDWRAVDPSMMLVNQGKAGGWKFQRDPMRIPRAAPKVNVQGTEENWGDLHAGWLDVDNDGWQDLVVASSDYPDPQLFKLYHQAPDGSGKFEDWTARLGFEWVQATGISFADVDRDGATDVLISRWHMRFDEALQKKYPAVCGLFHNLEPARAGNSFFNLRLQGQAVGARVTVTTGAHRQIREVQGGLGIGGHRDDDDCRFGAGKAKVLDRVEVRWPDRANTTQVFEKVAAGKFYVLKKGGKLEEVEREK
ncbi:MAG: CRTAC1 family protein [Planctomycetes bacterium]|nr:CRTAC1 family protein [Planctomycetota bacterium]